MLVLLSLVTFDQSDPSINHAVSNPAQIKNSAGLFGAYLSGLLVDIFGFAALVWPAIFIAWGAGCVSTWFSMPWWRWLGFTLLAACLISLGTAWNLGLGDVRGGGMLGMSLYSRGTALFSPVGSTLIWLFLLFLSLELAFGIVWLNLIRQAWTIIKIKAEQYNIVENLPDSFSKLTLPRFSLPLRKPKEGTPPIQDNELYSSSNAEEAEPDVIALFDIHEEMDSPPTPRAPLLNEPPLSLEPLSTVSPVGEKKSSSPASLELWEPVQSASTPVTSKNTPKEKNITLPTDITRDFSEIPQVLSSLEQQSGPRCNQSLEMDESSLATSAQSAASLMEERESARPQPVQTTPVHIVSQSGTSRIEEPIIEPAVLVTPTAMAMVKSTPPLARPAQPKKKYSMPSMELLQPPQQSDSLPSMELLDEQGDSLMNCLSEFNIQGELVRVTPGPVITLFEIRPAPGVRVGRFTNLTDDLARSLKAEAIRIQAPVPGCDTVGVEIPNQNRSTVNFRELVQSESFQRSPSLLTMALGKDIEGRPAVRDLATMPHVLVAGTTGSGKSVCLNSILVSFLYKASPDEVKLMLVDPKRVEMAMYADLPHLVHPVVTEASLAKTALEWAVHEMDKRYDNLARLGVKNIKDFNKKITALGENRPPELADLCRLPYLVIVIDELADLMLTAGKDVEGCIVRLAQLARAAGIHLIVATQRPSVDVVTGLIKANFPCRVSFQVANKYDSRTILDSAGAEQLLGKGDMLFKPTGGKLQRLHGPFVTDEEVQAVADYWKQQCAPQYEVDFSAWGASNAEPAKVTPSSGPGSSDEETLYAEAVSFVREQGRMSISLLQRRFRIGFNKAARFVERMEQEGILPPADRANKPRRVRME